MEKNLTYSVAICGGVQVYAKKEFVDLNEAITSAERIVNSQNAINNEDCTYAMIFAGKQMIKYIE